MGRTYQTKFVKIFIHTNDYVYTSNKQETKETIVTIVFQNSLHTYTVYIGKASAFLTDDTATLPIYTKVIFINKQTISGNREKKLMEFCRFYSKISFNKLQQSICMFCFEKQDKYDFSVLKANIADKQNIANIHQKELIDK